jgi:ADP-ribose pyrophosphatase YjhB (NUDIX family)
VKPPPSLYRLAHYLYVAKWYVLRPITTGVRVLVLNDRRVLLVRHTYRSGWFMPGGGLKRGETIEQAARRELREETGLEVGAMEVAGIFTNVGEGKTDHVVVFRVECSAAPRPDSPEVAECAWFALDALPEGVAPGSRRRITELSEPGAPVVSGHW